ncbi:MAG: DUF3820 family protein [Spirochaetales bacterium]|nr:DUF3820 family protein [Spirochaetales bacterium]
MKIEDIPAFRSNAIYPALEQGEAEQLRDLAQAKMPFGKYAGRYLSDLPEHYLLWFKREGFPQGELGKKMAAICELQASGLEVLLPPLRQNSGDDFSDYKSTPFKGL